MPPHQASGERDAPLASGGGPSLPAEGAPSAPSLDHCPGDTPQHLLMTPPLGDMTPNPHPDTALGEGGVAGLLVLVFVLLLVLVVVVVVVLALALVLVFVVVLLLVMVVVVVLLLVLVLLFLLVLIFVLVLVLVL